MRAALAIFGVVLVLLGALWTAQGMGWIMWPSSSFMLANRQWVVNGAVTALAGVGFLFLARRPPE